MPETKQNFMRPHAIFGEALHLFRKRGHYHLKSELQSVYHSHRQIFGPSLTHLLTHKSRIQ